MIKKRLISVLTFFNGTLFRTRNFNPDYRYGYNFVDGWGIDELVLLDITRNRSAQTNQAFCQIVDEFAGRVSVPLAVGGGIRSIKECFEFLKLGADKLIVNSYAFAVPEFISEVADSIGSQSLVVSIDVKRHEGGYQVMTNCGDKPTGISPDSWAAEAVKRGAGEIMLTSIDKDGTLEGYDNVLNKLVADRIKAPLLISGGAGQWQHFVDGINHGRAAGVCTSNIYHFTEVSVLSAKEYMRKAGISVRI